MAGLTIWRHPRPYGVDGRCIGRTDVPVDRRKVKRLAHRIRARVRRDGLPRVVVTSPLQRTAAVGRQLAAWGWLHRINDRLAELDFGDWDGRRWDEIGREPVSRWTDDFAGHRPGGGESVTMLLARCAAFARDPRLEPGACIVGHAGWINAVRWRHGTPDRSPTAAEWPRAIGYGECVTLASAAH